MDSGNDYKAHGRDEKLLEKLIPQYDNTLVQSMIMEAREQIHQIGRFTMETEPKSFYIKDMNRQDSWWEMQFHLPVIQYVPDFFRYITKNFRYNRQGYLENVPTYITNINHVTLFENYNPGTSEFGNNTEGIFKRIDSINKAKIRMSSLNLLLKHKSKAGYLSDAQNVVKMSFEMCYWNPPDPENPHGGCIDNLIYSTQYKIKNILLTRKTLVKILKINDRKEKRSVFYSREFQSSPIDVREAEVLVLSDDGTNPNGIKEHKIRVFLTEDIVDSLNEEDMFNAFIVRNRNHHSKLSIPIIIGKIGKKIEPGNIKHLLAFVLWKILQNVEDDSSPTLVGSINEANVQITNIIQSNPEMFSSENFSAEMLGWTKDLPKKIGKAIEDMFPMYQIDGNNIYQLSPVLMSYLACTEPKILQNKQVLMLIMRLFEQTMVNQRDWGSKARSKLRFSDQFDIMQKKHSMSDDILHKAQRIVNRIVYSRVLSQHHTHW